MNSVLLGFDVLLSPESLGWRRRDKSDRDAFFLNPEVDWPIAVDRLICPSAFQPDIHPSIGREMGWDESEQNVLDLWRDVNSMTRWIERTKELRRFVRFSVAFQVLLDTRVAESDPLWITVSAEGTQPTKMSNTWVSLGFDVADRGQTSGLSNCRYEPDEIASARLRWARHVNEFGLIDHVREALAFQAFSNSRVPEHSPFYVYEVVKLGERTAGPGGPP